MASTKITRTSATSTEKKLTISTWIKRSYTGEEALIGNTANGSNWAMFYFNGNNQLQFASYISGSYVVRVTTNRKFNDVGAWYHLQATLDVSLATPEAKIYVNGEEQTDLAYNVQPSQNADTGWFYDWNFEIGVMFTSSYYLNGCLADTYYIQGYVYPPSTFGENDSVTGEWKPNPNPTVSYDGNGGNSFNLKFENSANMDLDSGDNNISFTTTGTLTQTQDNPSNNFAKINQLYRHVSQSLGTLSNGDTTAQTVASGTWGSYLPTIGATSGKYYMEAKSISSNNLSVGIWNINNNRVQSSSSWYAGQDTTDVAYQDNGDYWINNTNYSSWSSWTTGDIIGCAMDLDNRKAYFHKNGTWQNSADPSAGTGGLTIPADLTMTFGVGAYNAGKISVNYGNGYFGTTAISSEGTNASGIGKFEYDVPTGYTALSTKGLNE